MVLLLRLTLVLAVGFGLTPALHAKAGFVVELCSPEGAVAVVLEGSIPADCPDCPDCLLSAAAILVDPTGIALHPFVLRQAGLIRPETSPYCPRHHAVPLARAPPFLNAA